MNFNKSPRVTDGGKFTKISMNHKITYEQFCDPAFRRAQQIKVKSEAVWVAFLELDGLLNISKFAKQYFGKSQSWFAQKLHGHNVCGKNRTFTTDEYKTLSASLRAVAARLEQYADEIDAADD